MNGGSEIKTCTCGLVYVPVPGPFFNGHHRKDFPWDEHDEAGVSCDICGLSYVLPANEAEHCKYHADALKAISPKRDQRFSKETDLQDGLLPVTAKSKQFLHNHMLWRARVFKKELGYNLQWSEVRETDPDTCGYLFVDTNSIAVGACKFMFRRWEDDLPSWSLEWVWIAPKYRRTGVLSQRWKSLQERHGDFHKMEPFSPAFEAFLLKQQ